MRNKRRHLPYNIIVLEARHINQKSTMHETYNYFYFSSLEADASLITTTINHNTRHIQIQISY